MAWMDDKKEWGLLTSAWGDVLCSMATFQESGLRKVIYLGHMDPCMRNFLEAQPGIEDVILLRTPDLGISKSDLIKMCMWFSKRAHESDFVISSILKKCNIDINVDQIYNASLDCFLDYHVNKQSKNITLPDNAINWSKTVQNQLGLRDYVLVNPYSINSSSWESHWPHWESYLDWLVSHEQIQFVFVGLDYRPTRYRGRSNVIDLVAKTPTMMHAMALGSDAAAVITTINSMAHWCNSQDLRCVVMHNSAADRPHDTFERICASKEFYKVWFRDPLETGIALTRRVLDLSGNGPVARGIDRSLWLEESHSMASLYNRMPAIPRSDFFTARAQARDGYDLMRQIGQAVQPESCYEIGARLGHNLLAICAGSPRMQRVGWCDNESQLRNSNRMACRNLEFFGERYGRPVQYSYIDDIGQAPMHSQGHHMMIVDGEKTRLGIIRDLDIAFAGNAELILVEGYFEEPVVRYAVREWAVASRQPLRLIHTFRGLAAFDTTPDSRHAQKLRDHGIACDLVDSARVRY